MQKILPRIQGSSESTSNILRELFKICAGSFINNSGQTDGQKMKSYLDNKGIADYYYVIANQLLNYLISDRKQIID